MSGELAIEGDCVWSGDAVKDEGRWRFPLEANEIAEIDSALTAFTQMDKSWPEMRAVDFPLPGLSDKLAAAAEELENGRGLALISGLPVANYAPDALRTLWFGIGLNLGRPVFQDCHGLLMREIQDTREDTDSRLGHRLTARDGSTFTSSKARTLSSGPLRFHTDRCDVVGLMCVRQATKGGISQVVSAPAVHNAIRQRHPDLFDILYEPLYRSRLGEEHG